MTLDLDEIHSETMRLAEQSYRHDGLRRTEVLWLIQRIADLIVALEAADTAEPVTPQAGIVGAEPDRDDGDTMRHV